MSANHVLLWMSATSQGSWAQFRGAIERLASSADGQDGGESSARRGFPLHQEIRWNLQRLGHAEFRAQHHSVGWHICPPTLAANRTNGSWLAVLAGARWPQLLGKLAKCCNGELEAEIIAQPSAPDAYRIRAAEVAVLKRCADELGLFVQLNAPLGIASAIPAIRDRLPVGPFHIPHGDWLIHRFATSTDKWEQCDPQDWESRRFALYRFQFQHERRYALWAAGHLRALPNPQVGKYLALRKSRRDVLRYDERQRHLAMPKTYRPPILVDRALSLASGLLPQATEDRRLRYTNIDQELAEAVAGLLGQRLR